MGTSKASALLSLIGVLLLWPYVLTKSVSYRLQTADSSSLSVSAVSGHGGERPHVEKRSTQKCESTHDSYCLNNGQCMLLVDLNQHHCKCEKGFYGPRCSNMELVVQPMGKKQKIVTIFCVILLIIGLAGALYFCCQWYKKNKKSAEAARLQRSPDSLESIRGWRKGKPGFPQFPKRTFQHTVTLPDEQRPVYWISHGFGSFNQAGRSAQRD